MVLNNIWNSFWSHCRGQLIKVVVTAAVVQKNLEFLQLEPKWGKAEKNLCCSLQLFHWFPISDMSQALLFVGNCSENSHFSQMLVLLAQREIVARHTDSKCRNQAQTSWIIKKLIQTVLVTWFHCSINKDLNLNNLRCEQLQSLLKRNKSFVSQHCRQRPWRLETRTFNFRESCVFNCCWCYFQWKRSQHLAKASVKSSNLNLLEKAT